MGEPLSQALSHGGRRFRLRGVLGVWREKAGSEWVCIVTLLNINIMGVCVDAEIYSRKSTRQISRPKKTTVFYKGVNKMTFQDPGCLRGPGRWEWPLLLSHLYVPPVRIHGEIQTVAAACSPCPWRLALEAGRWGRRAWA